MRNVHLELPIDEDELAITDVSGAFIDSEIQLLQQYTALTQRVRNCTLLQKGLSGFQGLTLDQGRISILAGTCTQPELHELLHVLRPVTLAKERASFKKVTELLEARLVSGVVHRYLQTNRHAFQHGAMSLLFQIKVSGQPLFHESLLHTWLNGTQYHTDATKATEWAALEKSLGESNAGAVVMSQLHGKVVAVMNIDYVVRQVLSASKNDA